MIRNIQISNYAIIEELEINFSNGLTIITGETGAGKSILLGALGLIMGKRADTKVLYNQEKKCIIEANFEIGRHNMQHFFEENDIDYEAETVVRREITPSGKSRAFVNDTPVNLKTLQQLSGALIDLHQQFDTLDIHNVSFQLRMIDALADNNGLLDDYQKSFRKYQSDKRKLTKLTEETANAAKEIDYIEFQLSEFNEAELIDGEQEGLETESKKLNSAEDIKRGLSAVYSHLTEDEQSVVGQLESLAVVLNGVVKYDSRLEEIYTKFEGLTLELQALSEDVERIADGAEFNPERISEIQERLNTIFRLQSKHQVRSVQELLIIQEELSEKLTSFGDMSGEIEALEKQIGEQEGKLFKKATGLSKRRKAVVNNFEKKVHGLLVELSMEHARLEIQILPLEDLTSTGTDDVNFLFAANKGSRMQKIKDVASGGEISRLTLVTKSLVASAIPLPTLIFDEIDSGVSGDVALKMGNILRRLSNHHQVVSITHSPQIASKADAHYFVHKVIKKDRTATAVRELTHDERVRAIATMLSQNPPSAAALENARDLLSAAAAMA
ncbi:MAG: DNA repair protein RecN (Recombination protein N) [Saprospiraceae bacterium]|jgi:DNA repair protein RecN (Recombination protein N)